MPARRPSRPASAVAGEAAPATVPAGGRGAATRSAIIDAALALFLERGYDDTTMRAVAERAGVSVGNAYYYFASKEHLIQGFYDRAGEAHAVAAEAVLARERTLEARLAGVVTCWIDEMAPYRAFAAGFFRNAADPASPLSPFSPESAPARRAATELLERTVAGSTTKPPKAVRAELPDLLWLYQMGIVLYWVHDPSAGSIRTRTLVERTVPLLVRAIELSRLPVLRGTVTDLVALITELRTL